MPNLKVWRNFRKTIKKYYLLIKKPASGIPEAGFSFISYPFSIISTEGLFEAFGV